MTSPSRTRPAYDVDERAQLISWLDMQRAIIHWKCEGLSEEDAHKVVIPTSPLMTVAGLVSHMRWVEHCWFEVMLMGRPPSGPLFDESVEDGDMRVAGVPLAQLLAEYTRQCAVSDEIIAAHGLDDAGRQTEFRAGAATLRWTLLHMIEETARHAGHLDIVRELVDGSTGYY
ncbi:DinB family protein [Kitasatospora azatica]|uniref:DinB family protein n=1 Tax=Kitasatospora azatica TaxID=58347 RepID=UPI000565655B|nr:DinB family protein [Kitasatospora azatica]